MLILAFASMGVRAGAKAGREAKVEEEHCLLAHAQLVFLCSPDPTACACLVLPIRLGPSLSITNKDSFPQSRPQDNLIVQFSAAAPSTQVALGCVKLTLRTSQDNHIDRLYRCRLEVPQQQPSKMRLPQARSSHGL